MTEFVEPATLRAVKARRAPANGVDDPGSCCLRQVVRKTLEAASGAPPGERTSRVRTQLSKLDIELRQIESGP